MRYVHSPFCAPHPLTEAPPSRRRARRASWLVRLALSLFVLQAALTPALDVIVTPTPPTSASSSGTGGPTWP